jgi:hypothetical protein
MAGRVHIFSATSQFCGKLSQGSRRRSAPWPQFGGLLLSLYIEFKQI